MEDVLVPFQREIITTFDNQHYEIYLRYLNGETNLHQSINQSSRWVLNSTLTAISWPAFSIYNSQQCYVTNTPEWLGLCAHLVQAAHFLRRVDDLPAAGTLRVHPPNLLGALQRLNSTCYPEMELINVVQEAPTGPHGAALQPATPETAWRGWKCIGETALLLPHSAAHRPVWRLDAALGPIGPSATSWRELDRRIQEVSWEKTGNGFMFTSK